MRVILEWHYEREAHGNAVDHVFTLEYSIHRPIGEARYAELEAFAVEPPFAADEAVARQLALDIINDHDDELTELALAEPDYE